MKNLFLIRHAKSSWTDDSLRDIDRPLNDRGKHQVEAMAAPLLGLGALGGPIHVSHACRARQTIEGLLEQLPEQALASRVFFDPELYTFRWKQLFKWLKHRDNNASSLTLIGHNPALSDLAEALTGDKLPNMPTGAVMQLQVPVGSWQELARGKADSIHFLPPAQASYRLFCRKAPKSPKNRGNPKKDVPLTLLHQLDTIQALQPGVLQGADPEFLHQFRINLRRSRAITDALVTITGGKSLRQAITPLKHMARQTSLLRDLDVFLVFLETTASENPRLRSSLRSSRTLDFFRQWRERERQLLSQQLGQKAWRKGLKNWERAVAGKDLANALKRASSEAIHDTVQQRADQCVELFRGLSPQAPDEDFHELRKALKHLRYIAELDKPSYHGLMRELKKQQSLYGKFQDYHQQLLLLGALADSRVDQRLPPLLAELAQKIGNDKSSARELILTRPPRIDLNQACISTAANHQRP